MLNIAKLLPSEAKFHRLIDQLAQQTYASARHLKTMVETSDNAKRTEAATAITSCKAQSKSIMNEITRELCLTFVTPFDREDIQSFSSTLYKIPKTIEKVRDLLEFHKLTDIKDLSPQVDLILEETEALKAMVEALIKGHKTDEIMKKAALLDALETRGDDILSHLLADLLRNTHDPRTLILKKEAYDILERIIDRYRDAAGIALQIVLKNS